MPTKKIFLSDLCVGDIVIGRKMLWYPLPSMEQFPCFIVSKLNLKFNKNSFRRRNWRVPNVLELINAGWIPAYGKFEGNSWECEWMNDTDGQRRYDTADGYHIYDIEILISNPMYRDWNIDLIAEGQTLKSKTFSFAETSKNVDVGMSVRTNTFITHYLPEDLQIEIEAP